MNSYIRRVFQAFLAVILISNCIVFIAIVAVAGNSLEEKLDNLKNQAAQQNQKKKQNLSEIMKLAQQLEYSREKAAAVSAELSKIDRQIADQNIIISDMNLKLVELDAAIDTAASNIIKFENELNAHKTQLAKRVRAMYKEQKKFSVLFNISLLLESKNIAEMNKRLRLLNAIVKSDRKYIDNILLCYRTNPP